MDSGDGNPERSKNVPWIEALRTLGVICLVSGCFLEERVSKDRTGQTWGRRIDGKVMPPRHKLVYEPTKESYNYHTLLPELFTNQIAVVRGSRLVGKMKPCFGGPNF